MTKRAVVVVKFPEGSYQATVSLRKVRTAAGGFVASILLKDPIPYPASGGGFSLVYGMQVAAKSVDEAMRSLRASVMRDRKPFGGKRWRP